MATLCDKCDTKVDVSQFTYPDGEATTDLCWSCASVIGFCPACGWFVAGNEWADLHLARWGMCDECMAEVKYDTDDYDPYEEEYE